ncbi:MAG TPA: murein transglycosylase domain-containing protein [Bacteroidota bacterium]
MMKVVLSLAVILIILSSTDVCAQQETEQNQYKEFRQKERQGLNEQDRAYLNFKVEETSRYKKFYEEERKKFRDYVASIQKKWGNNKVDTSTNRKYVGYDNDFSGRRSVDFEHGLANVEALLDPNDARDPAKVHRILQEGIVRLINDKGSDDPLAAREKVTPLPEPVLTGQVAMKDGKKVTPENAQQFASEIALGSLIKREEVVGLDGKKRVNVSASFPLIPNHIRQRAEEFRTLVQKEAKRFRLDPRLVFATVHTESYFNPKARSAAPAYGLMQLVPTSGARSAYLHVYKEDKLLTPDYLFQPQNNVELGAGLLNLMMTKDFKDIKNEKSRVYCAIAGYNTGPGNVARSFAGKRDIPRAIEMINKMTPEQVFDHLRTKLPFEETRTYVVTVTEKMPLYEEWSGANE